MQYPKLPGSSSANSRGGSRLAFYEHLLGNLPAMVVVFELKNPRIIWANNLYTRAFGPLRNNRSNTLDEILSRYHPDDQDVFIQMMRFFEQHKAAVFTAFYRIKNIRAEYIWLYTSARIVRRDADEQSLEVAAVSIDFSAPVTYQRSLKQFSQEKLRLLNHHHVDRLSLREREVVRLYANGFNTREIAALLGLSFHTINNHRKNVLSKLQLKNLAAMVNFAVENGLD